MRGDVERKVLGLGVSAILAVSGSAAESKVTLVRAQEPDKKIGEGDILGKIRDNLKLDMGEEQRKSEEKEDEAREIIYDEVEVVSGANQFGEGWSDEEARLLEKAGDFTLAVFEVVYPGVKIYHDLVVIRPSTPRVVETLRKNWSEVFEKTDYSRVPYVVFPDIAERAGLLPGIYYFGGFEDTEHVYMVVAHEMQHYIFDSVEHSADRFSPHGASMFVLRALRIGRMPDPDYDRILEMVESESTCVCHEVMAGETLEGIAEKYKTTVEMIVKANGIKDPNAIEVGYRLSVPVMPEEMCGCFQVVK
jgi:hypothetical protein